MTKENQPQQPVGEKVEPNLEITLKKIINKDKPNEIEICLSGYGNEINTGIALIVERAAEMQGLPREELLTALLVEAIISNKNKPVEAKGTFTPKDADDFFEFMTDITKKLTY